MDISIGQNFIKEKKFLKAENFFLKMLESGNKSINVYFFELSNGAHLTKLFFF